MRLDVYITAQGLCSSRTQAQELINGGYVRVDNRQILKSSFVINEAMPPVVEIIGKPHPYVGRGGMKLEGALKSFEVDPVGMICVDVGASTGGFTDCLLQHGAKRVFAVDSGSDQLAQSLKNDSRVINIERFNARNLSTDTLGEICDLAVADLSFISQTYVLRNISSVLRENGIYIGLIKPQFECGPQALDRHGVVRSFTDHINAIKCVRDAAAAASLKMKNVIVSPIKGGDGNIEYLCYCVRTEVSTAIVSDSQISRLVKV